MRVVAAPDKMRGTATAVEVAAAMARAASRAGWTCDQVPLADGGEGTLDALGGPNRATVVTGPLGEPVQARWRLAGGTAVIEMAQASGLELVGGAERNDPVAASTLGTGQLIAAAVEAGASRIVVGVGGSATTDGGLPALRALPLGRMRAVELVVACDVRTTFVEAAEVFAPQKGATAAQVELLRRRLERLAQVYLAEYGVDVSALEGAGAAGGLAGGLAVAGARLVPGFDLVAEEVRLDAHLEGADLALTAEGFLDAQSFEGKVVGGVVAMAATLGVPVAAVAGEVFDDADRRVRAISLVERFGRDRALADPLACIEEATEELLISCAKSPHDDHANLRQKPDKTSMN
jgi:glycerate kinase